MSETPDFVGQVYKDTNTDNIWRSNSTTPGDWTLEIQNFKVAWTPENVDLYSMVGFLAANGLPGITSLSLYRTVMRASLDIENAATLQTIDFGPMSSFDPDGDGFYGYIDSCDVLTTISFGSLVSMPTPGGGFAISNCPLLTSVTAPLLTTGNINLSTCAAIASWSLPSLINPVDNWGATNCPLLATVSFPSLVPQNGKNLLFNGNALSDTSVNHVLARCVANPAYVSGTVNLSGGTSSAPSGQGLVDKATLTGRGVNVLTN